MVQMKAIARFDVMELAIDSVLCLWCCLKISYVDDCDRWEQEYYTMYSRGKTVQRMSMRCCSL